MCNCFSLEKERINDVVESEREMLRKLALEIHAAPELAFKEYKACGWLVDALKDGGFDVETGISGMETAFKAVWQGKEGGPTIALLAEYDALRKLGHACGHNLIGPIAVGAALALKKAFPDLPCRLEVLGTPAEEGGGGKLFMCRDGIFDDVDAVMMCHPKGQTMVLRGGLACAHATFHYYGKASHASSAPEKGISALDGVINSFVAINALRQFIPDGVRVHGIITKGGDAPNIVPDYCQAEFMVRAPELSELQKVKERVYMTARKAAEAAGATFKLEEGTVYAERNNNVALANLFAGNLESLGEKVADPPKSGGIGSSDIGDVSRITATIHPYIKICAKEISNHSPEFAEAAAGDVALDAMILAAKAMAMTVFDLCTDKEVFAGVRSEFEAWKEAHS